MVSWDELIEKLHRKYEPIFGQLSPQEEATVVVNPFFERASGFRKAADIVIDKIAENRNLYFLEMIPALLWLYRHALELYLKSMRSTMLHRTPFGIPFEKVHDLRELWNPIVSYLKSVGWKFEDGEPHFRVGRLVKEFAEIDTFGDRFRYPDSRHPHAADGLAMKFKALKLSMADVDLLAFGFEDAVSFHDK